MLSNLPEGMSSSAGLRIAGWAPVPGRGHVAHRHPRGRHRARRWATRSWTRRTGIRERSPKTRCRRPAGDDRRHHAARGVRGERAAPAPRRHRLAVRCSPSTMSLEPTDRLGRSVLPSEWCSGSRRIDPMDLTNLDRSTRSGRSRSASMIGRRWSASVLGTVDEDRPRRRVGDIMRVVVATALVAIAAAGAAETTDVEGGVRQPLRQPPGRARAGLGDPRRRHPDRRRRAAARGGPRGPLPVAAHAGRRHRRDGAGRSGRIRRGRRAGRSVSHSTVASRTSQSCCWPQGSPRSWCRGPISPVPPAASRTPSSG